MKKLKFSYFPRSTNILNYRIRYCTVRYGKVPRIMSLPLVSNSANNPHTYILTIWRAQLVAHHTPLSAISPTSNETSISPLQRISRPSIYIHCPALKSCRGTTAVE